MSGRVDENLTAERDFYRRLLDLGSQADIDPTSTRCSAKPWR
jgi:hypothetical protein